MKSVVAANAPKARPTTTYQLFLSHSDVSSVNCVKAGSSVPRPSNTCRNVGTTPSIRKAVIEITSTSEITG